jgi:hypothetical protein
VKLKTLCEDQGLRKRLYVLLPTFSLTTARVREQDLLDVCQGYFQEYLGRFNDMSIRGAF